MEFWGKIAESQGSRPRAPTAAWRPRSAGRTRGDSSLTKMSPTVRFTPLFPQSNRFPTFFNFQVAFFHLQSLFPFRKTPRKGPCRDPGEPLPLLFGKVRLLESANGRSLGLARRSRLSRSLRSDPCPACSRSHLQKISGTRATATRFFRAGPAFLRGKLLPDAQIAKVSGETCFSTRSWHKPRLRFRPLT